MVDMKRITSYFCQTPPAKFAAEDDSSDSSSMSAEDTDDGEPTVAVKSNVTQVTRQRQVDGAKHKTAVGNLIIHGCILYRERECIASCVKNLTPETGETSLKCGIQSLAPLFVKTC